MAEQATILIPDISGFTDFTAATEIDHSSHIITELLELIVAFNGTDFTLAEIEGDAVLFYRKGAPLSRAQLVDQCLIIDFDGRHSGLDCLVHQERIAGSHVGLIYIPGYNQRNCRLKFCSPNTNRVRFSRPLTAGLGAKGRAGTGRKRKVCFRIRGAGKRTIVLSSPR